MSDLAERPIDNTLALKFARALEAHCDGHCQSAMHSCAPHLAQLADESIPQTPPQRTAQIRRILIEYCQPLSDGDLAEVREQQLAALLEIVSRKTAQLQRILLRRTGGAVTPQTTHWFG